MDNVTPLWTRDVPPEDPVSLNDFARADIYTVRQVAARLGIGAGLAYELVRTGEIPAKRLGRRWVVPRKLFQTWLNEMPKGA
ncbi:MAG: helix-turn-helix domain-containing protein [Pseudonocardiaceae bacterium]